MELRQLLEQTTYFLPTFDIKISLDWQIFCCPCRTFVSFIAMTMHGEGNGNPLQYSCLENPVDRGAWWTAVHGVAQLDATEVT